MKYGPTSETPDISQLPHDAAVEAIVKWFFENFEDPANETPYDSEDGGGYVYVWGGPYDAEEEIYDAFDKIDDDLVRDAVIEIESDGWEWAGSGNRIIPEEDDEELGKPPTELERLQHRVWQLEQQLQMMKRTIVRLTEHLNLNEWGCPPEPLDKAVAALLDLKPR
jgi:hypothetical protein